MSISRIKKPNAELHGRYTALRRKMQARQARLNQDSPPLTADNSSQSFKSTTDETMHNSDETPSSEEEICSSMCSTRPPSRSSERSKVSQQQPLTFSNMLVDSSSRMATPVNHPEAGDVFQYLPPTPTQHYTFQHRLSLDHHMLDPSNFSPVHLSTLSEPMLTPRPEYLPGPLFENPFPLHASSLPNDWLSSTTSTHSINGFPFPESFDLSPLNGSHIDRSGPPQHKQRTSRRTTIVLEDIEETTLSKVMSILIQEKAKVRMETTHSDRAPDHR
jgi:hypothetical protein